MRDLMLFVYAVGVVGIGALCLAGAGVEVQHGQPVSRGAWWPVLLLALAWPLIALLYVYLSIAAGYAMIRYGRQS